MFDTSNFDALEAKLDAIFEQYAPQYPPGSPERDALDRLKATLKKQRQMYAKMATMQMQNATAFIAELQQAHAEMVKVFADCGDVLAKIGVQPDADLWRRVQNFPTFQ
jgi:hypothetical protein